MSTPSASDNNRGNGGQKKKRGRGGSYGNQNKNKKTKSEEVGGRKVASADKVTLAAIVDSAKKFEKLCNDHKLYDLRQTDRSQGRWKYQEKIRKPNPELISDRGCHLIFLMGRDIENFDPINPSALIHYLDNHNCPNGLMPVLALVLMELSKYQLSFKKAHEIICDFARKHNKGKENEGSTANLQWLNLSGWNGTKNNTPQEIFKGTYVH